MTLPPLSRLRERAVWWCGFSLYSCFGTSCFAYFGWGVWQIMRTRENPPTVTSMIDHSTSTWGPMPLVLFRGLVERQTLNATRIRWSCMDGAGGASNATLHPSNATLYPSRHFQEPVLAVTFYGLTPNFQKCPLGRVHINIEVLSNEGFEVYTWPPPPEYATEAEYQFAVCQPANTTVNTRQSLKLSKKSTPRKGTFWGFPSEGDFSEVSYSLTSLDGSSYPSEGPFTRSFIQLIVDPVIVRVLPISILNQLFSLVAKIGGTFAGFTALWYTIFKKKYAESGLDELKEEMTFRCTASQGIAESVQEP